MEVPRTYCSESSLQAGEGLPGTIAQAKTLFLLEYNAEWGAKAYEEARLPDEARTALKAATDSLPKAKIFLIKSHRPGGGVAFFAANLHEAQASLYAFHLASYQELAHLPLAAIAADDPALQSRRYAGPLILVCTNGRRDVCCARFGFPVYQALSRKAAASGDFPQVWEMSHVGGHRFAPNVLCLPQGMLYGRVGVEQASQLLEHCQQGKILLENLRGRLCYPEAVQAAEYFLRQATGELGQTAYRPVRAQETEASHWQVEWEATDGRQFRVALRVKEGEQSVYESCIGDKTSRPREYELEAIHPLVGEAPA